MPVLSTYSYKNAMPVFRSFGRLLHANYSLKNRMSIIRMVMITGRLCMPNLEPSACISANASKLRSRLQTKALDSPSLAFRS